MWGFPVFSLFYQCNVNTFSDFGLLDKRNNSFEIQSKFILIHWLNGKKLLMQQPQNELSCIQNIPRSLAVINACDHRWLDTRGIWVFLPLAVLGLSSSRCNAGPVWPHQLHPPTAASPPLYVPLVLGLPHTTAGLQSIHSGLWWSEVSDTMHRLYLPFCIQPWMQHVRGCLRVFVCVCVSTKVPGHIRPECQGHSEVQQHGKSPGHTGGNTTTQTPGPYGTWYSGLVRQVDAE